MGSSTTSAKELCLQWKDFASILSRSFTEMREEADFFDVRIACYDEKNSIKTIPAHKVVLSACSPFFKDLLRALNEDQQQAGIQNKPLIFLKGISYHQIQAMLDFMYTGQTKVRETELDTFLAAAEELQVKGLINSNNGPFSSSSETNNLLVPDKKRRHSLEPFSSKKSSNSVTKKSKLKTNSIPVGNEPMMVKTKNVIPIEDFADLYNNYQDHASGDLDTTCDNVGSFQDANGGADSFSTENNVAYEFKPNEVRQYFLKLNQDERNQKLGVMVTPLMNTRPIKWKCKFCHQSFALKSSAMDHFEAIHLQLLSHECQFCNRLFTSANQVQVHIQDHHRTIR